MSRFMSAYRAANSAGWYVRARCGMRGVYCSVISSEGAGNTYLQNVGGSGSGMAWYAQDRVCMKRRRVVASPTSRP